MESTSVSCAAQRHWCSLHCLLQQDGTSSQALCSWGFVLGSSQAVWSETAGDPFFHSALSSWHNAQCSGAGAHAPAHRRSVVLEEAALLEQASSQTFSKSHTVPRDVQIETDPVTFVWSLNGQQESQWERKASTHYLWCVTETEKTTLAGQGCCGALSS